VIVRPVNVTVTMVMMESLVNVLLALVFQTVVPVRTFRSSCLSLPYSCNRSHRSWCLQNKEATRLVRQP
jgi:hypothetical protein